MVGGGVDEVTCEWAMNGLRAAARDRIVIIVDVLSFSTAVTVATANGATILPCEWNDKTAAAIAAAHNAVVASKRGEGKFSLAPASLRNVPAGLRLVLPSPNGSTLAYAARSLGAAAVIIGSIRNASAVAQWAAARGQPIAVIAAGEKWRDGTTRFALEDWLGAGAIVSGLPRRQLAFPARAAAAAFNNLRAELYDALATSPSGVELTEAGYPDDVELAAELDADDVVPLLDGNAIRLAVP